MCKQHSDNNFGLSFLKKAAGAEVDNKKVNTDLVLGRGCLGFAQVRQNRWSTGSMQHNQVLHDGIQGLLLIYKVFLLKILIIILNSHYKHWLHPLYIQQIKNSFSILPIFKKKLNTYPFWQITGSPRSKGNRILPWNGILSPAQENFLLYK